MRISVEHTVRSLPEAALEGFQSGLYRGLDKPTTGRSVPLIPRLWSDLHAPVCLLKLPKTRQIMMSLRSRHLPHSSDSSCFTPSGRRSPRFLIPLSAQLMKRDILSMAQCFLSFCMILSVHASKMAEAKKVMWMTTFHFRCSGFSLATSINPFKR